MFKRLRWTLFGAAAGFGGSLWAQRRVRRTVERYLPEQVSGEVRHRLGRAGRDLLAAIDEGRTAMADREAELRSRLHEGPAIPRPPERGTVIEARSLDRNSEPGAGRAGDADRSGGPARP